MHESKIVCVEGREGGGIKLKPKRKKMSVYLVFVQLQKEEEKTRKKDAHFNKEMKYIVDWNIYIENKANSKRPKYLTTVPSL